MARMLATKDQNGCQQWAKSIQYSKLSKSPECQDMKQFIPNSNGLRYDKMKTNNKCDKQQTMTFSIVLCQQKLVV